MWMSVLSEADITIEFYNANIYHNENVHATATEV